MDYLVQQNRAVAGTVPDNQITASGKHVVVLGGGDTGADCIGTAHRQGALSVTNLAIGVQPPSDRPEHQPWPVHPTVFEVQSSHEEGGERNYLVSTVEFLANRAGEVRALKVADTEIVDGVRRPKPGTEREIPADLVRARARVRRCGAGGFIGEAARRGRSIAAFAGAPAPTSRPPRPACSSRATADAAQSLVVWAIAEGRAAAASVDAYLTGSTELPAPVRATDRPFAAV